VITDDTGTFKGDSPGKKLARLRMWLSATSWMRAMGVPYDGALVLAGHGGDISTLMGAGIDPGTITGVDIAEREAQYTGELYPGSTIIRGDVGKYARLAPSQRPGYGRYNAAHLDFCNGITPENLLAIADVIKGTSTLPCWIGVTVQKGREAKGDKSLLVPNWGRKDRREIGKLLKKKSPGDGVSREMLSSGVFDPTKYLAMCESRARRIWKTKGLTYRQVRKECGNSSPFLSTGRLSKTGQGMVRADVIRQCLNTMLLGVGAEAESIRLRCVHVSGYHSGEGRKQGGGSGFVTIGFIAYVDWQGKLVDELCKKAGHLLMTFENTDLDIGMRGLKHYAIDLTRAFSSKQVGLMLDLKKEVVAAWKAHDTMGTYDHEIAEMSKARLGASFYTTAMEQCHLGWGLVQADPGEGTCASASEHASKECRERRQSGGPRWEE